MQRKLVVILGLVLLVLASGAAAQADMGLIVVYDVWARPTTGGEGGMAGMNMNHGDGDMGSMGSMESSATSTVPSAAYFMIENRGAMPVVLASVTSPVAGRAEIHRTVVEDNVARMEPMEDGVEIAPGETFSFEPGGYHVMLLDLVKDLQAGDYFALTLHFEMTGDEAMSQDVMVGAIVQDLPYENDGVVVWIDSVDYDETMPEAASAVLEFEYPEDHVNRLVNISHMGIDLPFTVEGADQINTVTVDLAAMFDMMYVPETLALPITITLEDGTSFDLALPFSQASEMMGGMNMEGQDGG